jgi:hypothetical protein
MLRSSLSSICPTSTLIIYELCIYTETSPYIHYHPLQSGVYPARRHTAIGFLVEARAIPALGTVLGFDIEQWAVCRAAHASFPIKVGGGWGTVPELWVFGTLLVVLLSKCFELLASEEEIRGVWRGDSTEIATE